MSRISLATLYVSFSITSSRIFTFLCLSSSNFFSSLMIFLWYHQVSSFRRPQMRKGKTRNGKMRSSLSLVSRTAGNSLK